MARPKSILNMQRNDIIETIALAGYDATEEQVEMLARANISAIKTNDQISGSYFRILLTASHNALRPKHQGKRVDVLEIVSATEAPLYAAVLRGITTSDVAPDPTQVPAERQRRALERNRRSAFARSAKSIIVNFIKAGGDLRKVDVEDTSKDRMRQMSLDLKPPAKSEDQISEFIESTLDSLKRAILRLSKLDKDQAVEVGRGTVSTLAMVLSKLGVERAASPKQAVKEQRPIELEGMDFWPVGHARGNGSHMTMQ